MKTTLSLLLLLAVTLGAWGCTSSAPSDSLGRRPADAPIDVTGHFQTGVRSTR